MRLSEGMAETFITNYLDVKSPKVLLCSDVELLDSSAGLRNDFSSQLHKFVAHLTDAQHKTVGHTVLYIPDEGPVMASPRAHDDKDLVQRLEGQGVCVWSHVSILQGQ